MLTSKAILISKAAAPTLCCVILSFLVVIIFYDSAVLGNSTDFYEFSSFGPSGNFSKIGHLKGKIGIAATVLLFAVFCGL